VNIIGITVDGKYVIDGVLSLRGTYGLHLADVFALLDSRKLIPSWPHFCVDATAEGWTHRTITAQLDEALVDVYGSVARDRILRYVEALMGDGSMSETESTR
jgi:hypothetical protein